MSEAHVRPGIGLLRKPNVAKLATAYLISYSGTAMAPIAMAFGVLAMTGSTSDASIVIAAPTLASIFVLLIGGALADRTSRKRLMVFSESLAALTQFSIAALFLSHTATIPSLTFLMLINGAAMALNTPAANGIIPQIVEPNERQAVNALLGTARHGAMMLGAALAGVLVAFFGAAIAIAIDATTFLISACLIATLRPTEQTRAEGATIFEDLLLGWKEFISHQWLWTIVLQFSFLVAAMEAVFGLLGPAMAKLHMNGAIDWGLIAAANGAGTIIGGLIAMRLDVQRPMLFATNCVFFFALLPLALAVPLPVAIVMLASMGGGIAGQCFATLWYTTLQTEVPMHLLSRVSAYDHLGSTILAPLGIVAGGFAFESLGARPTLLSAAAIVVAGAIIVLFVPGVRNLRTR